MRLPDLLLFAFFSTAWAVSKSLDSRLSRYETIRIIGGEDAQEDEYPFAQVSIKYPNGAHMCGASLIAPELVLTAAHCITEGGSVVVGEYDFADPSDAFETFAKLRSFVHPLYDSALFRFDMAVIQLHQSVQSKYTFSRLNNNSSIPWNQQDVLVLGWGATKVSTHGDDSIFPNVLQETSLEVISNQRCEKFEISGSSLYKGEIFPEMICAWTPGTDACSGDSGGPLISVASGSVTQVGVVSWGRGCALYPGVYSRVSSGFEWIRSVVCAQSKSPPNYLGCASQEVQNSSFDDLLMNNSGVDDDDEGIYWYGDDDSKQSAPSISPDSSIEPSSAPNAVSIPQSTSVIVILEIQLDSYSSETGWFLACANGTRISEFGAGNYSDSPDARIRETMELSKGESYTFVISDSGGNGLCCKDGNGSVGWYRLYVLTAENSPQGSTILYGVGNFGYGEEREFEIAGQEYASKTSDETGGSNNTSWSDLNRTTMPAGLNTDASFLDQSNAETVALELKFIAATAALATMLQLL